MSGSAMTSVGRRLIGLCLPPVVLCTFDAAITLYGQSAAYWAGEYFRVNEGSPTPNHLLQAHPAAFVVGIILWQAVFVTLILFLPDVLALVASIAVTYGHTWGASTWLMYRFRYGYQCCIGLALLTSVIVGAGIYFGWQARPAHRNPLSTLSPFVRWPLIALLLGVVVYLYLWPRTP